jgi:hypothetical protein
VADEFHSFSPPAPEGHVFKILGRSRLQVKDYVYVPGQPVTGIVKSRFRSAGQEFFIITQSTGQEIRIQSSQASNEEAQEAFRLLPFAVGETRIGDSIYHTIREKFGKAVGLVFSRESKLVVQLEDETILLLALPASRQIPENRELSNRAHLLLTQTHPEALAGIHLEAGQGILYARGTCASLIDAIALRKTLQSIPSSRGTVDIVSVQPLHPVADDTIIEALQDIAFCSEYPIFGIDVQCKEGMATVNGYCRQATVPAELQERIEAIPGLRGLQLQLLHRPQDAPGDREKALAVGQALRRNATIKDSTIRIYSWNGVIHLEGVVRSTLQRNAAALAAMWAGRNFKIVNHLRISRQHSEHSYYVKVS